MKRSKNKNEENQCVSQTTREKKLNFNVYKEEEEEKNKAQNSLCFCNNNNNDDTSDITKTLDI